MIHIRNLTENTAKKKEGFGINPSNIETVRQHFENMAMFPVF